MNSRRRFASAGRNPEPWVGTPETSNRGSTNSSPFDWRMRPVKAYDTASRKRCLAVPRAKSEPSELKGRGRGEFVSPAPKVRFSTGIRPCHASHADSTAWGKSSQIYLRAAA